LWLVVHLWTSSVLSGLTLKRLRSLVRAQNGPPLASKSPKSRLITPSFQPFERSLWQNHQSYTDTITEHSLHQLVDGFILSYKLDGKPPLTIDGHQRKLARFISYLEANSHEAINHAVIRSFLGYIRETYNLDAATVQRYLITLKAFWRWAVEEGFVPQVHAFVMFEHPKWLEASGRISHILANVMRGMAKMGIRPLLTFKKGALVPAGLRTNARDTAGVLFRQLEKDTERSRKTGGRIRMAITHGDTPEEAQRLREMAERELENIEVAFISIINDVVGSVTGPNTLSFAWCEI
jgi:hypothetical protein